MQYLKVEMAGTCRKSRMINTVFTRVIHAQWMAEEGHSFDTNWKDKTAVD